ncbi:hypothetical protein JTB14_034015 [Gonioctena quinquepunctata]|nr:hypothetical protein JTB14_034015 [Gonioctena quinquepunctata]
MERKDIITWRRRYLRQIKASREKNVNLIYSDKFRTNIGASVNKEWKDTTIKNPRNAFVKGLTTGLKALTQRGPRFVLLHAGTGEGSVDGAELTFLAEKGAEDHHDEMDGDLYEDQFESTSIPSLPKCKENVIVLDNASYHSREFDFPTKAWNKALIQAWLIEKDIFFVEDYFKNKLIDTANAYRAQYGQYKIEAIARKHNIHIVRLPLYHCELNPIEMVWSQVKRYVASHNTDFKHQTVEYLIEEAYRQVTKEQWSNYVNHVEKVEEDMWKVDNLQDDMEPIMVNLENSDDEFDEDDDEKNPPQAFHDNNYSICKDSFIGIILI